MKDSGKKFVLPSSAQTLYGRARNVVNSTRSAITSFQNSAERKSLENNGKQCINVNGHTSNLIQAILQTRLLNPEHVNDLSEFIKTEDDIRCFELNGKMHLLPGYTALLASCGIAAGALEQNFLSVAQIGLLFTSTYCSYKAYNFIKCHRQETILNNFAVHIYKLFLITKKVKAFILESEIALGKEQRKLLFPELRKDLCDVLRIVTTDFANLYDTLRLLIHILPVIYCDDKCKKSIEDVLEKCNRDLNPTTNEINNLHALHLSMQSECLKRLILSLVGEFTTNFSRVKLDKVIKHVDETGRKISIQVQKLERAYSNRCKYGHRPIDRSLPEEGPVMLTF